MRANLVASITIVPDEPLWSWLKRHLVITSTLGTGTLLGVIRISWQLYRFLHGQPLPNEGITDLIQLLIIVCLIAFILYKRPTHVINLSDAEQQAQKAVWQFWFSFLSLLAFWAVLYIVLLARFGHELSLMAAHYGMHFGIPTLSIYEPQKTDPILNFFNNLSTLALIACYVILRHRTVELHSRSLFAFWVAVLMSTLVLLIILGVVESTIRAKNETAWADTLAWLSAGAACVTIALLTEELGSVEIGTPMVMIAVLYGYAGVQLTWPFVIEIAKSGGEPLATIAAFLALLGKVCLSLSIIWSIDVGRLTFYMLRLRERLEKVPSERREFIQQFKAKSAYLETEI